LRVASAVFRTSWKTACRACWWPPGDADALAAAIRRVRDDPALARGLGEAGRRRLREQFNWPAIVQRWLDVYTGS